MKRQDSHSLNRRGWIVTVEGVDAVGKRTQSLLLQKWLEKQSFKVASLSFPAYETPIGKEIKAFLAGKRAFQAEVRHMLFAANRWEKLELIKEFQSENDVIIINRYTESNMAYGAAHGLRLQWLVGLEEGLPKSNLVLVLDAPSKSLVSRRPGVKDAYEKDDALQDRVQALYKELAPRFGWKVIDGSGSVRQVHESIIKAVKGNLTLERGAKA